MDKRKKFLKKLKAQLAEVSEDQYIINAVRAYYDLKKVRTLFLERIQEWINNTFHDPNLRFKKPEDLEKVLPKVKEHGFDDRLLRLYVELYKETLEKEKEMKKLIEENVEKMLPNASYIAGPFIAGMLLEKAGSFKKLVSFPASTIQVLGAEKALFKHLRSNRKIKPPKHGILFLHPYVHSLPKKLRGKMARTLAAKLAIAFKADYVGDDVKEELKEKIEKRYKSISQQRSR
ncbi:MAG: RNA-processing protein [Candidatus Micrarchaeota archaeon]|nr:RNA-processing protein [Candidatus Micrarchaeota archaeon]